MSVVVLDDLQKLFNAIGCRDAGTVIRKHFGNKSRTWLESCFNGSSYKINKEFVDGLAHYGYELRLRKIKSVVPQINTNADYIRHMTDEELATFLHETSDGKLSIEEYTRWLKDSY